MIVIWLVRGCIPKFLEEFLLTGKCLQELLRFALSTTTTEVAQDSYLELRPPGFLDGATPDPALGFRLLPSVPLTASLVFPITPDSGTPGLHQRFLAWLHSRCPTPLCPGHSCSSCFKICFCDHYYFKRYLPSHLFM